MYIDKPTILKGSKTKYGYIHLIIKNKHFCVHRLVAEAFIPNPNNYPIINHINGIKTDNRIKNLEWCTYSYNEKQAYKSGLKKHKKHKKINQYDLDNNLIKEWESLIQIKNELGYSIGNIYAVCKNERKTAYKSKWKFKEDL